MSDNKSIALVKGYDALVGSISQVLDAGRSQAAWALNSIVSAAYWEVGRRIVEFEQAGRERADYGERVMEQLSIDLRNRHGRGFGRSNLFQIRAFFLAYREKVQTVFGQSPDRKVQTVFGQLSPDYFDALRKALPLPWSLYFRLLSVESPTAREFARRKLCALVGRRANSTGRLRRAFTSARPCRGTRPPCFNAAQKCRRRMR